MAPQCLTSLPLYQCTQCRAGCWERRVISILHALVSHVTLYNRFRVGTVRERLTYYWYFHQQMFF
ncbi:Hypothetical predicted protein [Pelobates cultripes]|uniref:Uncharacterized protein n=1 Tax=Pelobates cultripes TaxID=61616 RepID=A0AAD1TKS0_PELCU|nr:Hypothetical predicted protein [Pelobates cultripes]